jgi:hypothetical protein
MEDFVTWVDTSKLKRTIARYNDEVCALFSRCGRDAELRPFLPSSLTISICCDVLSHLLTIPRPTLMVTALTRSLLATLLSQIDQSLRYRFPGASRTGVSYAFHRFPKLVT